MDCTFPFGFPYVITENQFPLSPCIFPKDPFPGHKYFRKNFAIANTGAVPYIIGWNPEKRRICILIRYVMAA